MGSIGEPNLSSNSDNDLFLNNTINDEGTTQIVKNSYLDKSHDEKEKDTTVRVAVRIRPQIAREMIDMCRICTKVTPGENHVILGSDNAFTFDYVFDTHSLQSDLYGKCVDNLVEGSLKGYNATVLAYGQTGSGKTYTMGTGFDRVIDGNVEGIIPRAVRHIFSGIELIQEECRQLDPTKNKTMQFSVAIQFMELYNEDIIDLLDPYNKGRVFKIHEDTTGSISVSGATIRPINGPQEALQCLQQGALARTTASTQMNEQSSRSHALFTILIRRQRVMSEQESGLPQGDLETLTSKFHFVDLAGSERLKRTGATGERAREGISINCGLLALGNVISALGDKSKRATHVPYRDSKLTRLLQDSLGGNSQTIMIACVSPSDRDFMETLNTLKYANRARNIKNKVMLNQDQNSRIITQLRKEISDLQLELIKFKKGNISVDWIDEKVNISDLHEENRMLSEENKKISQRLKVLKETIDKLTKRNTDLLIQNEMNNYNTSNSDKSMPDIVGCYIHEIEILKAKLIESDLKCEQFQKAANTPRPNNCISNVTDIDMNDFITTAKLSLQKKLEIMSSRTIPGFNENLENLSVDVDESPESDTDTESEDKAAEMVYELDTISSDIELKSKLIEQLELSQERMHRMRQHYEEKLNLLGEKIQKTQKERDQVLANMNTSPNQLKDGNEKVKKVREEYERKISDLQKELRKLQSTQKEHLRQQRAIHSQDVQLRTLRCDLADLKSTKIRLIRKMNDETSRHKDEETRKTREIAQLRKESRKQQTAVKSLQAQVAAKDQVLKRKTEQVSALRKSQRSGLSNKAAGLVPPKKTAKQFMQRAARSKWENLNRNITRVARNKQVIVQLEHELERLINDREMLSKEIANLRNKPRNLNVSDSTREEEDTLKANLNYIQQNIEHVQQTIMEFEESKGSPNEQESLQNDIEGITSVEEAKFLLSKLAENTISNNCESIFLQNKLIESETMLKDIQQESTIQQQLLQHFLSQNPSEQITDLFDSMHLKSAMSDSVHSIQSNMTFDIPNEQLNNTLNCVIDNTDKSIIAVQDIRPSSPTLMRNPSILSNSEFSDRTPKVRRRTAHPQDLLFGEAEVNHNGEDSMTQSYTQQEQSPRSFIPLARVPSAPGSLKQVLNSPSLARKNVENIVPVSPRLSRRQANNKGSPGLDEDVIIPAQSPPVYRRLLSREEPLSSSGNDVFSRLGAGTQDPSPGGSIQKVGGKIRIGVPLYCTHTVSGHNNAVLSIKVNGNILYTAAADRTVKVWDLSQETAQHCLSTHPGPVIAIQNDIATNLLYSASGPFVRVWDLRSSNTKPIKTLCSSGQLVSGTLNISGLTPGESPITALCLGGSGNLYVAASDKVRIWDIRSMSCLGKLSGGHQAAVMCVTSWEGSGNTDFIATGSKDHYVKVFEVPSSGGVVYPLLNLEPPHYDGVQALAVAPDALGADAELFSGSRDSGIKRWDLKSGELKQSLNNAHKGWVSGMAISGDVLLSSCRGGIIRLWNVKSCESLAELKTDSSINDIVASGQRVFTASSNGKVRMWRFTNALKRQCSLDSS